MNTRSDNVLAFVPARGGSKGLPDKNILQLAGRPMITYSIEAAIDSPAVDRCVVSTDDDAIADVAANTDAQVLRRPPKLATDEARIEAAIEHALTESRAAAELRAFDHLVLLQPTSPLRDSDHVTEALKSYFESTCGAVWSVTEVDHHPYKMLRDKDGELNPLFGRDELSKPRQSLPKIVRQNGAIYIVSTVDFLNHSSVYVPPVTPYLMDRRCSLDIDTRREFERAQRVLVTRRPI